MATSFFLSRRALKPSAQSGMPRWQDRLFIALSRSANDATDYFQIPTGRVVEVGTLNKSSFRSVAALDFIGARGDLARPEERTKSACERPGFRA
jgi:hypothetical protein